MSAAKAGLVVLVGFALSTNAFADGTATESGTGGSYAPAAAEAPMADMPLPPVTIRLIEEGKSLPIDLATALAVAGAKNLDILQAKARLAEAQGVRTEALGAFLPEVTGSFTAKRIDGEIQASFGELERHAFSTVLPATGVGLSLNPGQALFAALAAHRSLAAAGSEAEQVTQDVLATVAQQYFSLEEAQARVRIAEQALTASRELARLARDREGAGAGLKVDVLRATARAAADEVRLVEAQSRFREASVRLALGLKLDPTVTLFPRDIVVRQRALVDTKTPLAALIEQARTARADLAAHTRRLDAATNRQRASWAEAIGPTLYGTFEESAIGRSLDDVNNRQIYGGFIGVRLAPAAIGRLESAAARVEQVRLDVARVEEQITAEVVAAYDQVRTAEERIAAALRGLRAAEATEELSQVRFRGGVGISLEILDAETTLTEARTTLVAAIIGYDASQVRLLRSLGAVSAVALLAEPNRAREGQ